MLLFGYTPDRDGGAKATLERSVTQRSPVFLLPEITLKSQVKQLCDARVEVMGPPKGKVEIHPKRWVVEAHLWLAESLPEIESSL